MITERIFEKTLNVFINDLEKYDEAIFRKKINLDEWSLAQLYAHIIIDTHWYFDQLEACFDNCLNFDKTMTDNAKEMLLQNNFPNIKIKGNSSVPENDLLFKNEIKKELKLLLERSKSVWNRINHENIFGKTEHPGFGYMLPIEWYQFTEMHLRHHFKQLK